MLEVAFRKAAASRRRAAARRRVERFLAAPLPDLMGGATAATLARRIAPAWPSAGSSGARFASLFPEEAEYAMSEAEALLEGRLRLFGRVHPVGSALQAAADAAGDHDGSAREGAGAGPDADDPADFGAAGSAGLLDWHYRPSGGDLDLFASDPKFPWEVARHACFPRLGIAWWLSGNPRFAEHAAALLLDWTEREQPGHGLHHESALEVGIRLIAACQAFHFFAGSSSFAGAPLEALLRHLAVSAAWLEGHLSTDRVVAGNHLLGELAGLIVADLCFPELGRRDRLRRTLALFTREMERQVGPDGVSREQSATYGRFVADFAAAVLATAAAASVEVPSALRERSAALARWLGALTRPDGLLPLVGDNDGGRGVDWGEAAPSHDARGVVMALAVLLDDPAPLAGIPAPLAGLSAAPGGPGRFPPGAGVVFWWTGEEGLSRLEVLLGRAPARPTLGIFPDGGHAVIHGGIAAPGAASGGVAAPGAGSDGGVVAAKSGPVTAAGAGPAPPDADYVFLRCGPFGHGLPKPSAHSHADWMAPIVILGGHEILVDPGNFGYTTVGAERDAFRIDEAHNLFVAGGAHLARPGDTFRWDSIPLPAALESAQDGDSIRLAGRWHPVGGVDCGTGPVAAGAAPGPGAPRPDKAVACARSLIYNRKQRVIRIEDEWSGPGGPAATGAVWRWHLPPGASVERLPWRRGFRVLLPDGASFVFELSPEAGVRIEAGRVAPGYALRLPAPVVVVERAPGSEPAGRQVTVLRPEPQTGRNPA